MPPVSRCRHDGAKPSRYLPRLYLFCSTCKTFITKTGHIAR